ncbi:MAG: ABC transporter permease [Sulfuritalea sp.]|jgi:NitT/TauT family transport system permease protein|nr:ABC transporter permease [Sulfuritalea sp.]
MNSLLRLPGVPPIVSLLALLSLWHLAAVVLDYSYLPPPIEVLKTLPALLAEPETAGHIIDSLKRMAGGFALAVALAVPLGLTMGRSRAVACFFKPLLTVTYPVPKSALMPIIMLWFGIGDFSKILVIFLGVSLPLIYHSYAGAHAVDEKLVWSAQAMGMGRTRRLFAVILPSALPEVMLGCRVGIVMALIVMVSSEMIARQSGVGNLLFNSADMAQYDTVYAVIVIISVIGFVADAMFEAIRRRLTFWADLRASTDVWTT